MPMSESQTMALTAFETHPDRYRHWKLAIEGPVARLTLEVTDEDDAPQYLLKQNSYDLYVDIELADALQRIRFEHPQVKVLVIASALERVFCAGANNITETNGISMQFKWFSLTTYFTEITQNRAKYIF